MRNKLVSCIFVSVLATLFASVVVDAGDRRDLNRDDGIYDVKAERILEGIVAGKRHIMEGFMYFPLKTADTIVEVQLGPKEYVERTTFRLKPGDMVIVVGIPVVLNKRGVVLVRAISGMNGTLYLRDDRGVRYKTAIRSEEIR
jgi:hypothetical protein